MFYLYRPAGPVLVLVLGRPPRRTPTTSLAGRVSGTGREPGTGFATTSSGGTFRGWLRGITRNLVLMHFRNAGKRAHAEGGGELPRSGWSRWPTQPRRGQGRTARADQRPVPPSSGIGALRVCGAYLADVLANGRRWAHAFRRRRRPGRQRRLRSPGQARKCARARLKEEVGDPHQLTPFPISLFPSPNRRRPAGPACASRFAHFRCHTPASTRLPILLPLLQRSSWRAHACPRPQRRMAPRPLTP